MDRSGKVVQTIDGDFGDYSFELSPDGRRIAVEGTGLRRRRRSLEPGYRRGTRVRMTAAVDPTPIRCGRRTARVVLFQSDRSGRIAWYWKALAGDSEQEVAPMPNSSATVVVGRRPRLAFHSLEEGDKSGIWIADVEPSRPPRLGTPQRIVALWFLRERRALLT
jgi:hypothetical protein